MAKKYQIWNKVSNIYTPVGEELSPEDWIARYQWIKLPNTVPVVAAGLFNGAFIGELNEMRAMCENQGADFSECLTGEEILEVIEAFEDKLNAPADAIPSAEERIAAALEFQVMMSLPDAEVIDE